MRTCPHCECEIGEDPKKAPRSPEQLRRYFALMRAVFHQWPESHAHQFSNMHDMRKYLQMKAGHREIKTEKDLTGTSKEEAMLLAEAMIRGSGMYAVPVIHKNTLAVFYPKSIAFRNLGHREFCQLSEEIEEVIKAETGLDPQKCLKEFKEIV